MPRGHVIPFTAQQDEVIRKCWTHNSYGHHAAKRAAELTGFSKDVCQRRAVQLGLVFTRERFRWTEPELVVVEANAHLSLETIQRRLMKGVSPPGVKRTRTAIASQINAQRFRANLDGMNHGPLADALGISGYKLEKFRAENLIVGERMESIRQACGYEDEINEDHLHWFYPNEQIVRLLFAARGEVDLRKVNQVWLMGLLEPFISLFQTAEKVLPSRQRDQKRIEVLEDLLCKAELERNPVKRRRGRPTKAEKAQELEEVAAEMRERKSQPTPLSLPAHPWQLSDADVRAIRARAGRLVPRSRRQAPPAEDRSARPTGGTPSTPSSEVTGTTSNESEESSESSNSASGAAILHSGFPSSGCVGEVNAS